MRLIRSVNAYQATTVNAEFSYFWERTAPISPISGVSVDSLVVEIWTRLLLALM